jgi:hypothetical protein
MTSTFAELLHLTRIPEAASAVSSRIHPDSLLVTPQQHFEDGRALDLKLCCLHPVEGMFLTLLILKLSSRIRQMIRGGTGYKRTGIPVFISRTPVLC